MTNNQPQPQDGELRAFIGNAIETHVSGSVYDELFELEGISDAVDEITRKVNHLRENDRKEIERLDSNIVKLKECVNMLASDLSEAEPEITRLYQRNSHEFLNEETIDDVINVALDKAYELEEWSKLDPLHVETVNKIKAILNKTPQSPGAGWVSVEERLPDERNGDLGILAYTGGLCMKLTFIGGVYYTPEGDKWCSAVTHWQPLPPPPQTPEKR